MGRQNFELQQEVLSGDWNKIASGIEKTLFDQVVYELLNRTNNAFFGDSFKALYASANSLIVESGSGYMSDESQGSFEPTKRLLRNPLPRTVNISSPDPVNDRIDIVCVKAEVVTTLTEERKFKDLLSQNISNRQADVLKDWVAEIVVIPGAPGESPEAPDAPAGYLKIAEVSVSAITGLSGAEAVTDTRVLMPQAIDPLFLNSIQGKINQVIEGAGLEVDQTPNSTQLFEAITDFRRDGGQQFKFPIANNRGRGTLRGMIWDKAIFQAVSFDYSVFRKAGDDERYAIGSHYLVNNGTDWKDAGGLIKFDDEAGVSFSVNENTGQLYYSSTEMGEEYESAASQLRILNIQTIRQ